MKILPHFQYLKLSFTLASFLSFTNRFVSHFNACYHFLRGTKELKFKLSFMISQLLYLKKKEEKKYKLETIE